MSKKYLLFLVVIVVVVLGLGVWAGMSFFGGSDLSPYSVVMATDGQIYFGKLSMFPTPKLQEAAALQTFKDDKNQTQVQVVPVKNSIWSQDSTLYFNSQSIISWSRLKKGSQVEKLLENPPAPQNSQSAPSAQTPSNQTSTPSNSSSTQK